MLVLVVYLPQTTASTWLFFWALVTGWAGIRVVDPANEGDEEEVVVVPTESKPSKPEPVKSSQCTALAVVAPIPVIDRLLGDANPTCGSFAAAATGLGFAGFFLPLLKPVFGVGGNPAIRQQGFQGGGVVGHDCWKAT